MKQTFTKPTGKQAKTLAFINARLVDPESGRDETGGLIAQDGLITDLGPHIKKGATPEGAEVIDCGGHVLAPGLVDIQVHFREPGQEHKETIESGSRSAVAGGITMVVCQPNTKPTIQDATVVEFIKSRARETSYNHIRMYGSMTEGLKGEQLADLSGMAKAGVVGFTDDGLPLGNSLLMRRVMEYAKDLGLVVAQHAEDLSLTNKGCINEGYVSAQLGVGGIPNASEAVCVERDILLNALVGGHYHVLHVSTREALDAVRRAKAKGQHVTCEVSPHHFTLDESAVLEHGTLAKMNPPLRSKEDVAALLEGLKDGTVDAIATDHAPHDPDSKALPLPSATFGIVGVETMLPISLELYHNKLLSLRDLLAKMTNQAADIIKQKTGRLAKGYPADLVVIDLDTPWTIDHTKFSSTSTNTPFHGRKVKGRAIHTVVAGEVVYSLS
ncbi:amidohydrolase family protein [bacterium]|nr:amidohydrolase family protein [bacterium]